MAQTRSAKKETEQVHVPAWRIMLASLTKDVGPSVSTTQTVPLLKRALETNVLTLALVLVDKMRTAKS